MASRLEVLSQFGFSSDPFSWRMESADSKRIKGILGMAMSSRAMVSVVGERGIGKSVAVSAALRKSKAKLVRVLSADKGKIHAGDIQEAMILDLSDETPRKTKEVRVRQLRRILGESSRKQPVVVVIEESHRLHPMTLRSIKNLRELDWLGETQLFTVVLIGQSDCTQKAGLAEVRLRTESVQMHGLTSAEVIEYVRRTVGSVFSEEAVAACAQIEDGRNYLDLQEALIVAMERALAAGRDEVSAEDLGITDGRQRAEDRKPRDDAAKNAALRSVLERRREQGAMVSEAAGALA